MQNQFDQNASSTETVHTDETVHTESIFGSLYRQWQRLAAFMVRSKDASVKRSDADYSSKARFYPYLPADEEARDWLEKVYQLDSGSQRANGRL